MIIRDIGKLVLMLLRSDGSLDEFPRRNPEVEDIFGKYASIFPEEMETPLTKVKLTEFRMEKTGANKEMMKRMEEKLKGIVFRELDVPDEDMFRVEKGRMDFSEYASICQSSCRDMHMRIMRGGGVRALYPDKKRKGLYVRRGEVSC